MNQLNKIRNCVIVSILLIIVLLISGVYYARNNHQKLINIEFDAYQKGIANYKKIDQQLYLSLPIYKDYINSKKQKLLRKHLLADHLKVAKGLRTTSIQNQSHLDLLIKENKIVKLEQGKATPWYFFNVKKEHRVLTPHARKGLLKLTKHFNQKIKSRFIKKFDQTAKEFTIKLAISSATRPESYQQSLQNRNANASSISSHSYGISVDIFYDEFYIYRNILENNPAYPLLNESKSLLGFSIGRARRRQLRAMLAESLLELQAQGVLYVIWERNQRCYHVTLR